MRDPQLLVIDSQENIELTFTEQLQSNASHENHPLASSRQNTTPKSRLPSNVPISQELLLTNENLGVSDSSLNFCPISGCSATPRKSAM